jgi:long-chain fatty acid transport protein
MPLISSMVAASANAQNPAINGALWTAGNLTATSLYPQVTLGGAYSFIDSLSVSAAVRYVYAYQTFSGSSTYALLHNLSPVGVNQTLTADVTKTAQGFGGIFGVDWKALQGLLVTGRFETATALPFTTKVNGAATNNFGGLFTDGQTVNRDLPALAAMGARYDWDAFSVTASGTCYILGPSVGSGTGYVAGYNSLGWEEGLSGEYAVMPGFLKVSAGGMMTTVGGGASTYNDFDFSLDSSSLGGGAVITVIKDLDVTLAASKTFYTSTAGNQASTKYTTYKKDAFTFDVGVQYKLF